MNYKTPPVFTLLALLPTTTHSMLNLTTSRHLTADPTKEDEELFLENRVVVINLIT